MRKLSWCTAWAVYGLVGVALGCGGCAKPETPSSVTPSSAKGNQQGSTTGGGTEVPMPATTETPATTEQPATTETPSSETPKSEESKAPEAAPAEEKKPEGEAAPKTE